jgi:hypothetical protein
MTTRPHKKAAQAASKPDFAALLGRARMPERTVPVCLAGDLAADFEQADRELELAQKKGSDSLAGNGTAALLARIDALSDEMAANTYPFRLRALTRPAWRELCNAHPPRKDDKGEPDIGDLQSGVNRDTFMEPLLRASIVDPELSDETFADLVGKLTDRQYEELVRAAWDLNQGEIDIPFSRAALRARRATSGE